MKSKFFLACGFLALAFMFQSPAQGQRRPMPDTGKPNPTGTVTGGTQNIINSKLLIYTKNGLGTTSTSTNGEFASQLVTSATVDKEFAVQWSRTKTGKAEKGMVYIRRAGMPASEALIASLSATMPAQSTAVNIAIVMPNYAADNYELRVVGETGSSSKVAVTYSGKGNNGPVVVITPVANGGLPAPSQATISVIAAKFTPTIGAPGDPAYKRAQLRLTLRSSVDIKISRIEVQVQSEPFTNPELTTKSNSKNSPIVTLKGAWKVAGGAYPLLKDKDFPVAIILKRTSNDEVQDQEGGPGAYSPADWGYAFGQTTTATFRWNVGSTAGGVSGSVKQSAKNPWLWP